MKIDWIYKKEQDASATIYDNNITLSKAASNYFNDAYAVLIGIDRETRKIVIKNISKEEAMRGDINKINLHEISLKASYGRITGKRLINEICETIPLDFKANKSYKFNAKWNTAEKMLVIETGEEGK
jgi:hypothetical protein